MRPAHNLLLALAALTACADPTFFDISGEVNGNAVKVGTAHWGGPFVVGLKGEVDCKDFSWAKRSYQNGEEVGYEDEITGLQISYNEGDVVEGTYSVEGEAPISARYVELADGYINFSNARTGTLTVEGPDKKDRVSGSFEFGFEDGEVSGEFTVDYCNNLVSKQ